MSIRTIFLVVLYLTASSYGQAANSGDVTIPQPALKYQDANVLFYFHIHHATDMLVIYAKLKSYSYFALLFNNIMDYGDYNIIQPGVTVDVRDCVQTTGPGHGAPVNDATSHLTVLGYDTDGSTYVIVKYERPLNTGDAEDAVLVDNMNFTWAYAFATGSQTLVYHTTKARFSGVLSNTGMVMTQIDFPLIHGIILTILWCLLADIAVWVKYTYSFKYRLFLHGFLMTLVTVGTIVLSAIMIARNAVQQQKNEADKFAHVIIGLIALGSVCLIFLGGIVNRLNMKSSTLSPKTVYLVRKFHKYFGYILLLTAKANAILGWAMEHQNIAVAVVAAQIGVVFLLRFLYVWNATKGLKGHSPQNIGKVMNTQSGQVAVNEGLDKLTSLPYNHPSVQAANFVIFDDNVYALPTDDFHPGGRYIIDRVKGRQIDRFLYGALSLEDYPDLKPFEHPKSSMVLLGEPKSQLPVNTVCTLNSEEFKVSQKILLSRNLSLLYFKGLQASVDINPINNSRHIGQYFVVSAFDMTRLYTCVLSETKSNRALRQNILLKNFPGMTPLKTKTEQLTINDHNTSSVDLKNEDNTLPLLIKYYDREASFTKKLYNSLGTVVNIRGPKGRGLCLEAVPSGDVAIIAGGTGLFPFLDLLDLLFKATIAEKSTNLIPKNQLDVAKRLISGRVFHVFISVEDLQDLVVPDELNAICQLKPKFLKLHIRVRNGVPANTFVDSVQTSRFGSELVRSKIASLPNLSMVYICGTQEMYKDMNGFLNQSGINNERIFFV